jgi:UDP-glucose 4-epimerase
MKYLVTGGAGFIGSTLVDKLVKNGYPRDEVIVLDDESANANEEFYWNKVADNHKVNISEYEQVRHLFDGVDVVFHMAAEAKIQPSIENPLLAVKTNVLGTATVLQCAREAGVGRVVYSSTSSAYGLKNEPPLRESMPRDCLNPYSVSKTAGEDLCLMYTELFELETVVFRYFNVFGERQPLSGQYAPVIGIFIRQDMEGESLTIVGDGEQRRDFVHVSDVVKANISAGDIKNKKCVGNIINVGTGVNYSVNEVASFISDDTVNLPPRLAEAKETLADTGLFYSIFEWKPNNILEGWIKTIMTKATHGNQT